MSKTLAYDPSIWVEDPHEYSINTAPPESTEKPIIRPFRREHPSAIGTAAHRAPPTSATRSDLGIPALLASLRAELSASSGYPACFPTAVGEIHAALRQPGTSMENLLRLVQAEPRLAELTIVLANAAMFGHNGKPVAELRDAASRLGKPIIRAAAAAFAIERMKDELRLRSIAAPLMDLWQMSLAAACLCHLIARRTKVKPEDAFCAGMLHGVGYLYIMARAVGKSSALGTDLLGHDLIAESHPAIGGVVLAGWGASEELTRAVSDQQAYGRLAREEADLADVLIAGVALAKALQGRESCDSVRRSTRSFDTLKLTGEHCTMALKHTECRLASLQQILDH